MSNVIDTLENVHSILYRGFGETILRTCSKKKKAKLAQTGFTKNGFNVRKTLLEYLEESKVE